MAKCYSWRCHLPSPIPVHIGVRVQAAPFRLYADKHSRVLFISFVFRAIFGSDRIKSEPVGIDSRLVFSRLTSIPPKPQFDLSDYRAEERSIDTNYYREIESILAFV